VTGFSALLVLLVLEVLKSIIDIELGVVLSHSLHFLIRVIKRILLLRMLKTLSVSEKPPSTSSESYYPIN
jgi:hypothetical protein